MKKILVLNGANINMIGIREVELYGTKTYVDLLDYLDNKANELGLDVQVYQSNHEGDLIDYIQSAYDTCDGIVINAGGYTHTSVAILDALKGTNLPTVEVHLTNLAGREDFRQVSYVGMYAEKRIMGKGFDSYGEALEYLKERLK